MTIADLFAGPGGWDLGARWLGLETLGFEYQDDVCDTRRVVGLPTVQADLSEHEAMDDIDALIASPPCPAFSNAGPRGGYGDLERLCRQAYDGDPDWSGDWDHPQSKLMLAPLRWLQAGDPEWVAFEQVPPAMAVWNSYKHHLESLGWSCWAGVVNVCNYGVPQTRERAIFIGSKTRKVSCPQITHSRNSQAALFQQTEPWVGMREALIKVGHWPPQPTEGSLIPVDDDDWRLSNKFVDPSPPRPLWTTVRKADEPSMTIVSTVNNDFNWFVPNFETEAGRASIYDAQIGAINTPLTEAQGLTIQGFPADYPITDPSKYKRWHQIGNAVPPPLARAVLSEVTGISYEAEEAPNDVHKVG